MCLSPVNYVHAYVLRFCMDMHVKASHRYAERIFCIVKHFYNDAPWNYARLTLLKAASRNRLLIVWQKLWSTVISCFLFISCIFQKVLWEGMFNLANVSSKQGSQITWQITVFVCNRIIKWTVNWGKEQNKSWMHRSFWYNHYIK